MCYSTLLPHSYQVPERGSVAGTGGSVARTDTDSFFIR
jgi:hypothetical protein